MACLISNTPVKKDSSFLEALVIMPSGIGQIRIRTYQPLPSQSPDACGFYTNMLHNPIFIINDDKITYSVGAVKKYHKVAEQIP